METFDNLWHGDIREITYGKGVENVCDKLNSKRNNKPVEDIHYTSKSLNRSMMTKKFSFDLSLLFLTMRRCISVTDDATSYVRQLIDDVRNAHVIRS